ncbi:MAG: hypothetical protein EPN86_01105 [Nanoarchaeota archaeon]|nr:MAG: hypothetical protein EPN86_01105 [Nanoarchaeota archaeon]
MKHGNLRLIGTSHIASQSIKEIKKAFDDKPEIVALELDKPRLYGLLHPEQRRAGFFELSKVVGVRGALFAQLARFAQRHFGRQVGIEPGSDMLSAYLLAKENNSKIFLIDQPIDLTLRYFSQTITWKEKFRLVWDILTSPFNKGESVSIDLRKVPEKKMIVFLLEKLKERYPTFHKVLVEDRNRFMARKLRHLMDEHPDDKILAVVGAGHEEGIIKLLKSMETAPSHSWTVEYG